MSLPADPASERWLVRAAAVDPSLWRRIRHLTPEHFLDRENRAGFEWMASQVEAERTWDGSEDVLMPILGVNPSGHTYLSWQIDEWLTRVEDALVCRRGVLVATEIGRAAVAGDVDQLRSVVAGARLPSGASTYRLASEVASEVWDQVSAGIDDRVPSGFVALDAVGALRKGENLILAARPSMGKSQIALQISWNVAKAVGPVAVASFEMSAAQCVRRIAGALAGRSTRDLSEEAIAALAPQLTRMMSEDPGHRVYFFDQPTTVARLHDQLRALADQTGGLALIVTDHVRKFTDRHAEERHRLGTISDGHVRMAREFGCPVICVSQITRGAESREDKKPGLPDLRDSGELEENADSVAFIYREAYYKDRGAGDTSGAALIYAGKNRNGPLWATRLWFDSRAPRFADMAREDQNAPTRDVPTGDR